MAFVTLEDLTGQIECLVFPRVYEKYQLLLQEDAAVVISGRISVREEESPKLLAERITRMEEWKQLPEEKIPVTNGAGLTDPQRAAQAAHKLFLRLERKEMEKAGALLALDPGEIPVYMHIPSEKITLLSPHESWCSGSEKCLQRLRETLGSENVVLR